MLFFNNQIKKWNTTENIQLQWTIFTIPKFDIESYKFQIQNKNQYMYIIWKYLWLKTRSVFYMKVKPPKIFHGAVELVKGGGGVGGGEKIAKFNMYTLRNLQQQQQKNSHRPS